MRNWKLLLAGLGLAVAFGAGWWLRPSPPPVIQEKLVDNVRTVEKIRIVEKRPDGTIIERDEERKIDQELRKDSVRPSPIAAAASKKYSLGIQVHQDLSHPFDLSRTSYTALLGYRPTERPVWLEAGWNWKRNEVTLGLRIEF